jgi:hypothetical protein
MSSTASSSLTNAHKSVFEIAERASVVLAGYESVAATLTYRDIASAIGIDLSTLRGTDSFLVYLALDAAVEHRGWQEVQFEGERKQFRKVPATKAHRKPALSPPARARELSQRQRMRA